jgi:hypothetical protein
MDSIEALVRSLPESADLIRRRFWRDAEFRTVCEDYRDAVEVLVRREQGGAADVERREEYRQLAAELLAEVTAMLNETGQ